MQSAQRGFRTWVVVLVAGAVLAGCGDCKSAQPSAAKAKPTAAAPAKPAAADSLIGCSVAPEAMVAELLGLPGLAKTSEKVVGKAMLCEYDVKGSQFVSIRFERGYDADRFEDSKRAFPNFKDIPGLGERAFTSELPMFSAKNPYGINSVTVLAKSTHVTISAPVPLDKITYLARELLSAI